LFYMCGASTDTAHFRVNLALQAFLTPLQRISAPFPLSKRSWQRYSAHSSHSRSPSVPSNAASRFCAIPALQAFLATLHHISAPFPPSKHS